MQTKPFYRLTSVNNTNDDAVDATTLFYIVALKVAEQKNNNITKHTQRNTKVNVKPS